MESLQRELIEIFKKYHRKGKLHGLTEDLKKEFAEDIITAIESFEYYHIDDIDEIVADMEPKRNEGYF